MANPEVSEYEKRRLENIRKNQEELKNLGINNIKGRISRTENRKRALSKNLRVANLRTNRKKKAKGSAPTRRSKRQQGIQADGQKLSNDFKPIPINGGTISHEIEQPKSIQGNVEIDEDGKVFLESLKLQLKQETEENLKVEKKNDIIQYAEELANLKVDADTGVLKLTPERIYSLDLSPASPNVVLAAGDKIGNFGLWNHNIESDSGVFNARPHRKTLSCVLFDSSDVCKIYTASYDGRITQLDANKMVFTEVYSCDEALFDVANDKSTNCLFVAREDGMLSRLDIRSKYKATDEWQLHEKKINTVAICPGKENYISTASLDRSMCIWDVRKMKSPLHNIPHALSINQSSWSPDGKFLVSVCMDNYLRTFDAPYLCSHPAVSKRNKEITPAKPVNKVHHDNRTGRWLTKFKIDWNHVQPESFVIGSMDQPRGIEVFSASGTRIMRMRTDPVASVQSLNKFHPNRNVIVSANSSGRVHVWLNKK
mmetsp:Transcript_20354/g.26409  ORF Transcript_20354/g.26409 Transcript_20354/m.26409 type:complete len:484 (+) Transcript_20354:141-1592(+)